MSHQEIWVRNQIYRPCRTVGSPHVQSVSATSLYRAVNTDTLRHTNCGGYVKTLSHLGRGISRSAKSSHLLQILESQDVHSSVLNHVLSGYCVWVAINGFQSLC